MNTNLFKLGGDPLSNSQSIIETCNHVLDGNCRHIVVSAPGECKTGEHIHPRVTQMLKTVCDLAEHGGNWQDEMMKVFSFFSRISAELGVQMEMIDYLSTGVFQKMETENKVYRDNILAEGERLTAKMLAFYLNKSKPGLKFIFVDPTKCIFFYKDGSVNYAKSFEHIRDTCSDENVIYIIPGFYGCGYDGRVKTFPFNGSDITGAIFAAALGAEIYDKGTDVGGIFTGNPYTIKLSNPKLIGKLTLNEAEQLSYLGTGAVHPDTMRPLIMAGITMRVRNPKNPDSMGTLVLPEIKGRPKALIGMAGKKDFVLIKVKKPIMNSEVGFALKALQQLKDLNIPFEHAPTGINTIAFAVSEDYLNNKDFPYNTELISRIKNAVDANFVEVIHGVAILTVVWTEFDLFFSHQITSALLRARIRPLEISGGEISEQALIYIKNEDLYSAEEVIHKALFGI